MEWKVRPLSDDHNFKKITENWSVQDLKLVGTGTGVYLAICTVVMGLEENLKGNYLRKKAQYTLTNRSSLDGSGVDFALVMGWTSWK